ncbi:MAG: sugar phosphate isomerase/epimerase [Bryobacterales bacterium]|nr:sugar phosphate isomerase/epimerase [Bryobacterales bacterium]
MLKRYPSGQPEERLRGVTRRRALYTAGAALAATLRAEAAAADPKSVARRPSPDFHGLKVGLASYSTRALSVDETIACCRRVGIRYITIKDVHLKLTSTPEERRQFRDKFRDANIEIAGCGVIYLKSEEEVRPAFEYVRDLGANTAVIGIGAPMVPVVEKIIKDFDIRAAIHNHGPEDRLGAYSPLDVMEWLKGTDKRLGICHDVGHTFRCGLEPSAVALKCASRLYDVHNKDLGEAAVKTRGVPIGQGVIDSVRFLKTLVKIKFPYHVALEYEVDAKDPVPGIAESIGFERGVLASL